MTAVARMPISVNRLKKRLENESLIFLPASVEEYWKLVETPQLRLDYYNHQIVAAMSYGSLKHETIVNNVSFRFNLKFEDQNCRILPSNRPIYAAECENIYEPDVHVTDGTLEEYHYARTKTATKNPSVIVEVFSPSTKNFDLSEKLDCYKMIPSLKHIIFIEPNKPHIQVFNRTKRPNEWQNVDFFDLEQKIRVLNKSISLKTIYKKVIFTVAPPSV